MKADKNMKRWAFRVSAIVLLMTYVVIIGRSILMTRSSLKVMDKELAALVPELTPTPTFWAIPIVSPGPTPGTKQVSSAWLENRPAGEHYFLEEREHLLELVETQRQLLQVQKVRLEGLRTLLDQSKPVTIWRDKWTAYEFDQAVAAKVSKLRKQLVAEMVAACKSKPMTVYVTRTKKREVR